MAKLVICDLAKEHPNVYYEIGLSHGLKKKVILTAPKGTDIPFDLKDYSVLEYEGMTDLEEKLMERIQNITGLESS